MPIDNLHKELKFISFLLPQLIDGSELTVMRTAAASASAAKVCHNLHHICLVEINFDFLLLSVQSLVPSPPSILCIVGSGAQARSHVQAFRACHSFSEVRIWGRSKEKADK